MRTKWSEQRQGTRVDQVFWEVQTIVISGTSLSWTNLRVTLVIRLSNVSNSVGGRYSSILLAKSILNVDGVVRVGKGRLKVDGDLRCLKCLRTQFSHGGQTFLLLTVEIVASNNIQVTSTHDYIFITYLASYTVFRYLSLASSHLLAKQCSSQYWRRL